MSSNFKLATAFFAGLVVATLGCAKDSPTNHLSINSLFESTSEIASDSDGSQTQSVLHTLGQGENLYRFINVEGTVLIDFYADWCGPCQTQGDVLHEMEATAMKQDAKIIKVNVDDHPHLAKHFKVTGLPTLLAFKDGNIAERQIGLANKARVASLLQQ